MLPNVPQPADLIYEYVGQVFCSTSCKDARHLNLSFQQSDKQSSGLHETRDRRNQRDIDLRKGYTSSMNLRIDLPPSLEQSLRQRASEAGMDVESFVMQSIRETLNEADVPLRPSTSDFGAWLSEVRSLVPQVSHFIDDSRESIYAGRGE
jgi:predicted HicB family RNase H-like nuclease